MANFKLDTKYKLDEFLKLVVERCTTEVKSAELEKETQSQMSDNLKGLRASDAKGDVEEGDEEEPVKAVTKDKKIPEIPTEEQDIEIALQKDITLPDLIDSLNLMRSGKSLKDVGVKNNIKQFFDGLTTAERQSMYVYINALAGIMTGTETGEEATDPQDVGIQTQEKPGEETKTVSTTVKTAEKETESAPIVVGESANKGFILQKVRELMRR